MPDRYRHVVAFIRAHPWAVLPSVLDVICELVARHIQGARLADDEIAARIDGAQPARGERRVGAIAVIPIMGLIAHRASMVDDVSGPTGTSTERVSRAFHTALADPQVDALMLDIQSPGGSVFGVEELADLITVISAPTRRAA